MEMKTQKAGFGCGEQRVGDDIGNIIQTFVGEAVGSLIGEDNCDVAIFSSDDILFSSDRSEFSDKDVLSSKDGSIFIRENDKNFAGNVVESVIIVGYDTISISRENNVNFARVDT
ncbi:unnamed protein product [Vicia faba]|uniref:Uncharacterized protein n=1 Tax=Vicia faba TaxID=3906 RepID=A0AAV0ZVZ6_VICFA|nr:unnamed protein product [Vicia faba]